MARRITICLLLLLPPIALAADVTLAVVNARVWTADPRHPRAEAIAIAGDRIVALGTNSEIRALATPASLILDGAGATLTPGFTDAHIHLLVFPRSRPLPPIFLRYLHGRTAVAARIAAYAAQLPPGAWILGEDWNDATWNNDFPDRAWLDRLAPNHPVWLTGREGNAGIANSAALRLAGIGPDTPDERPGRIVRDPTGQPTGIILGGPMWRVDAAVVEPGRQRDDELLQQIMDRLLRAGVTSVHHNNDWYDFLILRRLHQAGKLRIRVYASPPLPAWQRLRDYINTYGRGDDWMHWGGVKGFGAIVPESFYRWVSGATVAGLQVMTHAPDGEGLRTIVATYQRVGAEQPLAAPRFRVEHGHNLPADLIPVMARTGAIASWQPPLLAQFDQRPAAAGRAPENLFPCRALLNAGVRIAFGTDAQVWASPLVTPAEYLQMALERVSTDGSRITLDEALRAATLDAAYAGFEEQSRGSLEPGKLADFVLFDRDLAALPVHRIRESTVRLTVVGGRIAYQREPGPQTTPSAGLTH